jgi:DNA segregation ATPase FtsK/SpoIIIE-like protein
MVEHFTQPYFQRGREDLLTHIHRKSSSKVVKKSRSVKCEDDASDGRLQQELTSLRESQLQLAETMRQMQEAFMAVQLQHNQEIEQLKAKIVELSPRQPIVKSEVVLIEEYDRRREDFVDSPTANQPEQQQAVQQQNNGFGNLLDLVDDENMDWNDNRSDEFTFRNTWHQPQVAGV